MAKSTDVAIVEDVPTNGAVILSSTLANRQDRITDITSVSDLIEQFGSVTAWEEIEPGFLVVSQSVFEDKPAVILGFRFNQSKRFMKKSAEGVLIPAEFTSMLMAAADKEGNFIPCGEVDPITGEMPVYVIVNDGGTGINMQLERYASRFDEDINVGAAKAPPIRIQKGLRKSEYDYIGEDEVSKAVTWYIG